MQIVSDHKIFLGVFAAEPLSLVGIELTDSVEWNILTKAKNKSMKTLPSLFICQPTYFVCQLYPSIVSDVFTQRLLTVYLQDKQPKI